MRRKDVNKVLLATIALLVGMSIYLRPPPERYSLFYRESQPLVDNRAYESLPQSLSWSGVLREGGVHLNAIPLSQYTTENRRELLKTFREVFLVFSQTTSFITVLLDEREAQDPAYLGTLVQYLTEFGFTRVIFRVYSHIPTDLYDRLAGRCAAWWLENSISDPISCDSPMVSDERFLYLYREAFDSTVGNAFAWMDTWRETPLPLHPDFLAIYYPHMGGVTMSEIIAANPSWFVQIVNEPNYFGEWADTGCEHSGLCRALFDNPEVLENDVKLINPEQAYRLGYIICSSILLLSQKLSGLDVHSAYLRTELPIGMVIPAPTMWELDREVLRRYLQGCGNSIFGGRVAPVKMQGIYAPGNRYIRIIYASHQYYPPDEINNIHTVMSNVRSALSDYMHDTPLVVSEFGVPQGLGFTRRDQLGVYRIASSTYPGMLGWWIGVSAGGCTGADEPSPRGNTQDSWRYFAVLSLVNAPDGGWRLEWCDY